jgi:16S rRNA G966 N2-methylase RsmD
MDDPGALADPGIPAKVWQEQPKDTGEKVAFVVVALPRVGVDLPLAAAEILYEERLLCSRLRGHLQTLRCENGQLLHADALAYLGGPAASPYDLVFLDPPFSQDLLLPACNLLENHCWLSPHAWIYTESENSPSSLGLPGNWRLHREQKAGQVYYALWQRTPATN